MRGANQGQRGATARDHSRRPTVKESNGLSILGGNAGQRGTTPRDQKNDIRATTPLSNLMIARYSSRVWGIIVIIITKTYK